MFLLGYRGEQLRICAAASASRLFALRPLSFRLLPLVLAATASPAGAAQFAPSAGAPQAPPPGVAPAEPDPDPDADSSAAPAAPPSAAEPGTVQLGTVVVRANPLGRTSDQLVQPVTVLAGDELNRKRASTIGATLQGEPGISTTAFGAGSARPVIRGQSGSRVQILENGIGSLDVSDVSPDHAVTVSPAAATQIEVIRGPATLLYGSGASGGIVNINNTRLPVDLTEGAHGGFETYYGSSGDERAAILDANYGLGQSLLHFDYGHSKSGDYDIPDDANVDGSGSHGTLANSDTDTENGAASYAYMFGNSSVAVSVSRLLSTYGLPNEETAFIRMDQTRYDVQAMLNRPFRGVESIKLRGAYNNYEHTEFEAPGQPGTVFSNEENQERIEVVHVPLLGWSGAVGAQYDYRRLAAIGDEAVVPPTDSDQAGLFLIEERPMSFGRIELGARYDHVDLNPQGNDSQTYSLGSFSGGVIFDVAQDSHLKLYATRAQRAPSPEELYAQGPHVATSTFERGLSDASIESANNFEIGFDHHAERWHWSANVYYEYFQNYLYLDELDQGLAADGSGTPASDGEADRVDEEGAFDPHGELLLVDYRQHDARFWGYEAEAQYELLRGAPLDLALRLFTDGVRGELSNGDNLPRITPRRYGLGLDAAHGAIHGNLDYTRVDSADHLSSLETPTDGYNMLAADLSYHFRLSGLAADDSEIYVRARNLLNEDARVATSFIKDEVPLPGVSVMVGLRLAL